MWARNQERMTASRDAPMWRLISQRGRSGGRLSLAATPTRLAIASALTTISASRLFGSPRRRYPGRLLGRGPYHHDAEQRQINDHGNIVGDQQVELVGQGDRRQIGNRSGDDCSGDSSRPPDEPRQMAAKGWGDQFVHVSASFSAGCPTCRGAVYYNSLLRLAGCVTASRSWPTPCCCSSRYRLPCATCSMRDLYGFLSPALSPLPSSPTGSAGPPSSLRNAPAAPSAVCSMSASATSPN